MAPVVGRRLVALLAVLLGLSAIVFVLQTVIPSDPARAMVGASASRSVVEAKRHELGYDKPLPQRFGDFLGRLAQGDLQSSLRTRNPVSEEYGTMRPLKYMKVGNDTGFTSLISLPHGQARAWAGSRLAPPAG